MPASHQGLHSFLYDSDSTHEVEEEVVGAAAKGSAPEGGVDETRPVEAWAAAFGANKVRPMPFPAALAPPCGRQNGGGGAAARSQVAAVYAVFDAAGTARYVGITRLLLMPSAG